MSINPFTESVDVTSHDTPMALQPFSFINSFSNFLKLLDQVGKGGLPLHKNIGLLKFYINKMINLDKLKKEKKPKK